MLSGFSYRHVLMKLRNIELRDKHGEDNMYATATFSCGCKARTAWATPTHNEARVTIFITPVLGAYWKECHTTRCLYGFNTSTAVFFVSWVIYYSDIGVINKLRRGFRTYLTYTRVTANGGNTRRRSTTYMSPIEVSILNGTDHGAWQRFHLTNTQS
jgi:hypothetical protein